MKQEFPDEYKVKKQKIRIIEVSPKIEAIEVIEKKPTFEEQMKKRKVIVIDISNFDLE